LLGGSGGRGDAHPEAQQAIGQSGDDFDLEGGWVVLPDGKRAGVKTPAQSFVLNANVLAKTRTFLTERLAARTFALVFALDIVASVAVGIVVMDTLFCRVPRTNLGHKGLLLTNWNERAKRRRCEKWHPAPV
jgi:hypothetical protein